MVRVLGLTLLFLTSMPSAADTLDKIRASRSIVIGYRDGAVPFSYVAAGRPVGYTIDICHKIVEAAKTRLDLSDIQIRYHLVTAANRIPLVTSGAVDLECGTTANTVERQKQGVAFSLTYYVAAARIVSKKSAGIESLRDLAGRSIVALPGATHMDMLQRLNSANGLGIDILAAKERREAFAMVQQGKAAGFISDDALLAGLVAASEAPADYRISVPELPLDPLGLMMREEDFKLKAVADRVLRRLFQTGEIRTLYAKWFESPIPPDGLNLRFPISRALHAVIERPTDSPDPERYR